MSRRVLFLVAMSSHQRQGDVRQDDVERGGYREGDQQGLLSVWKSAPVKASHVVPRFIVP